MADAKRKGRCTQMTLQKNLKFGQMTEKENPIKRVGRNILDFGATEENEERQETGKPVPPKQGAMRAGQADSAPAMQNAVNHTASVNGSRKQIPVVPASWREWEGRDDRYSVAVNEEAFNASRKAANAPMVATNAADRGANGESVRTVSDANLTMGAQNTSSEGKWNGDEDISVFDNSDFEEKWGVKKDYGHDFVLPSYFEALHEWISDRKNLTNKDRITSGKAVVGNFINECENDESIPKSVRAVADKFKIIEHYGTKNVTAASIGSEDWPEAETIMRRLIRDVYTAYQKENPDFRFDPFGTIITDNKELVAYHGGKERLTEADLIWYADMLLGMGNKVMYPADDSTSMNYNGVKDKLWLDCYGLIAVFGRIMLTEEIYKERTRKGANILSQKTGEMHRLLESMGKTRGVEFTEYGGKAVVSFDNVPTGTTIFVEFNGSKKGFDHVGIFIKNYPETDGNGNTVYISKILHIPSPGKQPELVDAEEYISKYAKPIKGADGSYTSETVVWGDQLADLFDDR